MARAAAGAELAAANDAFLRADWEEACARYEQVLAASPEQGEVAHRLAEALWLVGRLEESRERFEQAYNVCRAQGDATRAGYVALWLSVEYASPSGNDAVASGWFRRGERLLEAAPLSVEHVELEIARGRRAPDSDSALRHFERGVEIARRFGDVGFEIRALSQIGVLKVAEGEIEEGMAVLDECMTAAMSGEVADPWAAGGTCCIVLAACERIDDFKRASEWCRAVVDFMHRRRYTPLWAWCRATFASILIATGEWQRAEDELRAALRTYGETHRQHRIYALARLAELRLRQGRLEEAEGLLEGCEDQSLALQPLVTIALLRGNVALAEGLVARRLATVDVDAAGGMQLLPLVSEVRLAGGDLDGAEDDALRLRVRAADRRRENLVGFAELLLGRIAAARGDSEAAVRLEAAAEIFDRLGMPLEKARAKLELAQVFAPASPELAVVEARAACREFERLGAQPDADRAAALLRSLGVSGRTAARSDAALTGREQEVLALLGLGLTNAEIAERLFIAPKTAEHHVGRVLRKLGLRTRAEAAVFAVRLESDEK